jgi:uncharacterized membrane protein YfcA
MKTLKVSSILFSFFGASIVGILSQDILKVILGIFLIIISVLFLVKPSLNVPTNRNIVITGGSISGLITGLVGTGGALRATFLTGFNLEKTKYIATAAVIALGTDATRIPLYLSQGFLLEQYYYYIPILAATAIGWLLYWKKNCWGRFIRENCDGKKVIEVYFDLISLLTRIFLKILSADDTFLDEYDKNKWDLLE